VRPSDIYKATRARVKPELEPNFMGFAGQTVRFLGHGVGLQIDEYPVLTTGFDEPLQAGMTIALEPKIGIAGVGMVGVEDTYVVTPDGGVCLTGGEQPIVTVPLRYLVP
jgi:Xaa-Pro aminopeptidase